MTNMRASSAGNFNRVAIIAALLACVAGASEAPSTRGNASPAATLSRGEQLANGLYDFRVRLLVTPEQSPAWEAFHARFMELAASWSRVQSSATEQSALEAMQRQLSAAQDCYTLTENLAEATKVLYAALSVEQRRTADQMLPALLRETARTSIAY